MFKRISPMICVILLAGPMAAFAQKADDAAALVAPYVDDQTFFVGALDLRRANFDITAPWVIDQLKAVGAPAEATDDLRKQTPAARQWIDSMLKAGVTQIFCVLNIADIPVESPPLIVPLPDGADAKAIAALMITRDDAESATIGGSLVVGPRDYIERVRQMKATARPELAAALAGDGALRLALIPPADARKVIEQLWPDLPAPLGGGSGALLARGLLWANLTIRPPSEFMIKLTLQCSDATSADALNKFLVRLLDLGAQQERDPATAAALKKTIAALPIRVAGERVILTIDNQSLIQLLPILAPAVKQSTTKP